MIDPVLIHLGPLEIRYYGLVYVFGFLASYFLLRSRRDELGLKDEEVDSLAIWAMAGLIVFARLIHFVFDDISIFWNDPLELIRIWHGGMSFFGGLVGACLGAYFFLRKRKVSMLAVFDLVVVPASVTLALGRIANFINQEIVGRVTDLPWCVNFTGYYGCRHPYQIYAAISHFVMFGILIAVMKLKIKKKLPQGLVFASFLMMYGFFRFITDFWRDDTLFFHLTLWQYFCIGLFFLGLYILKKIKVLKR